jgi:WD40 repeat protein
MPPFRPALLAIGLSLPLAPQPPQAVGTVRHHVALQSFGWVGEIALAQDGRFLAMSTLVTSPTRRPTGAVLLLDRRSGQEVARAIVEGPVTALAFSTDGRQLAFGTADGAVELWASDLSRRVRRLVRHRAAVGNLAFVDRESALVSIDAAGTRIRWALEDGRRAVVEDGNRTDASAPTVFALSADGTWLLEAPEGGRELAEPTRIRPVFGPLSGAADGPPSPRVDDAAISQHGTWAAILAGETLLLWERSTAARHAIQLPEPAGQLTFSPDERAVAVSQGRHIGLVDVATGTIARSLPLDEAGALHSFTPDGRAVIVTRGPGDGLCEIALDTGAQTWCAGGQPATQLLFTPDGRQLIAGGSGRSLRAWDTATWTQSAPYRATRTLDGLFGITPDGRRLVMHSGPAWDVASRESVPRESIDAAWLDHAWGGIGLPGDSYVYDRGGAVGFMVAGRLARVLPVAQCLELKAARVDGRWLACRGVVVRDGTRQHHEPAVVVIDAAEGRTMATVTGHTDAVTAVAFSPDGRWMVSASRDASIRVWDIAGLR